MEFTIVLSDFLFTINFVVKFASLIYYDLNNFLL